MMDRDGRGGDRGREPADAGEARQGPLAPDAGGSVDIAETAGRKYIAAASHVLANGKTPNLCMSLDPRAERRLHGAMRCRPCRRCASKLVHTA